jgi:hypothetical protein
MAKVLTLPEELAVPFSPPGTKWEELSDSGLPPSMSNVNPQMDGVASPGTSSASSRRLLLIAF